MANLGLPSAATTARPIVGKTGPVWIESHSDLSQRARALVKLDPVQVFMTDGMEKLKPIRGTRG